MEIRIVDENNLRGTIYTKDNCVLPIKYGVWRFYSYGLIIADWDVHTRTLTLYGDNWDYSNTTRRYFKQFVEDFTDYEYDTKKKFEKLIHA